MLSAGLSTVTAAGRTAPRAVIALVDAVSAGGAGGARASAPSASPISRGFHATASSSYKAPMNEVKFLLNDVLDIQGHYAGLKNTGGELAEPEMVDAVLTEMGRFCEQVRPNGRSSPTALQNLAKFLPGMDTCSTCYLPGFGVEWLVWGVDLRRRGG